MNSVARLRLGLALGSGAARGWAHLGVLRALQDLDVVPDVVCGSSIGALIGGFYLSGDLPALEDWARRLTKLKLIRYLDFRVPGNGLIGGNRLFAEMARYLRNRTIEDLPAPFASVVTDLYTGHEIWLSRGCLADAIRASFSLPGVFEPVKLDGRWVVDGALVNPVPVSVCHALGAQVVVAINLNTGVPGRNGQPRKGAPQGVFSAVPRWPGMVFHNGGAPSSPDRRIGKQHAPAPGLIGVMASTLNIVQDRMTRSRLAAEPPDVHIAPKVADIGLLEFHRADEAIAAGQAAVYQAEDEIRAALRLFEDAG